MLNKIMLKSAKGQLGTKKWDFEVVERDEEGHPVKIEAVGKSWTGFHGNVNGPYQSKIIFSLEVLFTGKKRNGMPNYTYIVYSTKVQFSGIGAEVEPLAPIEVDSPGMARNLIVENENT